VKASPRAKDEASNGAYEVFKSRLYRLRKNA